MVAGAVRGRLAKMHLDQKTAKKALEEVEMGNKRIFCNGEHLRTLPWSSRFFCGAVTFETPHDQLPQHVNDSKAAELGVACSYYELGNHQK